MPQLIRSWFEPWKRITESRGRGFNLEDLAGYVIIGLLSRIVGFILRSSIISLGLFCLLLLVVAGFALYTLWVALPLIIVAMFVFGLTLLIA
ncbi:hypothetical protein H6785_02765 [Candidatus Nomurabacteria bacterium]|nr:hypothetical protein [Candidatus Nomurabacteria bacterium]